MNGKVVQTNDYDKYCCKSVRAKIMFEDKDIQFLKGRKFKNSGWSMCIRKFQL